MSAALSTSLCTFNVLVPISAIEGKICLNPSPPLPFMSPLLLRECERVSGGCLHGVYLNYAPASVIVADSVSVISFDQSQVLISNGVHGHELYAGAYSEYVRHF